ncbi:MAG: hypothetical protein U5L08_13070 [Xanthomonadales bacterium]|nr:hypothetical protein [Xanthomonadales bacterium]
MGFALSGLADRWPASRIFMVCAIAGGFGEGPGKVVKFAEIVAGTVLAGEIFLGAAISSLDWVSSHDHYGRNDPTRQA